MVDAKNPDWAWVNAAAEVLRALNAEESLESLLTRVARQTCVLAGFDSCSVILLDSSQERLTARASHALTEGYRHALDSVQAMLVNPVLHELDVPATQAVREGRTVMLADVDHLDANSPWRSAAQREGIKSVLAVPLGNDEGCVGVLVGYAHRVRQFSASEIAVAELMAQYAAIVLKTADLRDAEQRTIARLQEANSQLRTAVESLSQERGRREWAEQQDRKLVRLLLDDVGLGGVLQALAEALEAAVLVENPEDGAVVGQARGPVTANLPTVDERLAINLRLLAEKGELRDPVYLDGDDAETWVVPIAAAGEVVARLWVIRSRVEVGADAALFARSVIERFSLLVALELLKRRHSVDIELRLTRDLAVELVTGSSGESDLVERARALGHDLSRPHTVVLVPLAPRAGVPTFRRGAGVQNHLATRLSSPVLVGEHDGVLVALVSDGAKDRTALRQVLSEWTDARAPIVIGPTVLAVMDYPAAWRTVRRASVLAGEHERPTVLDIDDLGVAALLLDAGTPESLRHLADRRLLPIEEHDVSRGTNLTDTLRAWLRHGCATAETARALHVHPHTISYRLRRVAELTGVDPQSGDGVFELRVAVMVRDVQRAAAE